MIRQRTFVLSAALECDHSVWAAIDGSHFRIVTCLNCPSGNERTEDEYGHYRWVLSWIP